MAEGGTISISTSGVGVAMLAAQDNLDRKTGCPQAASLTKTCPKRSVSPTVRTTVWSCLSIDLIRRGVKEMPCTAAKWYLQMSSPKKSLGLA